MRRTLETTAARAIAHLERLGDRNVGASADRQALLHALDRPLSDDPEPVERVLDALARGVEPGLIASGGPRYFGFVIGGTTEASLAADWLTSAWDQNAQVYATSPAAAVVEEIVARWVVDLLGLPPGSSVGLVTGGQMANFAALCAARNAVLARRGWSVDDDGLIGAPPLRVFASEVAHATVHAALRMAGIGQAQVRLLPADRHGNMSLEGLDAALAAHAGPAIVTTQAGNVNTGAFEPFLEIVAVTRRRAPEAWIHVDGAFGLWAAAAPSLRNLTAGIADADSWAVDAHKWLNVPYDSGIVIVRDPAAHRSLKSARCAYAGPEQEDRRDGSSLAPENSRRARAFVLYAALRTLGRSGLARLIEAGCARAKLFASLVQSRPHLHVVNDVVLNQVLVRVIPPAAAAAGAAMDPQASDALHERIAAAIQDGGECWFGTTRWQGRTLLRFSFSSWMTEDDDVHRTVAAIDGAMRQLDVADSGRRR